MKIPQFLADEIKDYMKCFYDLKPDQRLFFKSKGYLGHEITRGSKKAGIKRINIHALRHSHISLLMDRGFSALDIAERVGHEAISITYKYAHMYPNKQDEMARKLEEERSQE